MVEVEFNYKQNRINIQSNMNDIFEDIIQKYINKTNLDINKIYFISNGTIINKKDRLENIMSESDKRNKKIIILVNSINSTINIENANIKKSKDIICPLCKEICKYEIKDYKIKLYDCKNGHINEDINLNEFENNQIIDISKIKCNKCKDKNKSNTFKCKDKNKSNTFNNDFYICYECNMNLCPLCKSIHDQTHSIINYDNKDYICNKHGESLVQYCNTCNIDMCLSCSNEHKNHEIIIYQDKLIDKKILRNKMNEFKDVINKLNMNIEGIINKLKKIMENMNIIYDINNNILTNYEANKNNRNYKLILNFNYMNEYIENEINNIKNKYNYGYNINQLVNIGDKKIIENKILNTNNQNNIINQNINENNINNKQFQDEKQLQLSNQYNNINDEIIYKPNKKGRVRLFGNDFVKNNKEKCKIIYNNKEYELKEYFDDIDKEYNNKDEIKIKLKGINSVTDMSKMFCVCETLSSLPDISKWDTSKVTNIRGMFDCCFILSSLPDISKWDTSKVTNISGMFNNCKSLYSLPDISKWDTSKVIDMCYMFSGCETLSSLPDISKWDTSKVTNMSSMFEDCNALSSLPDISKWDISNVTDMSFMFCRCNTLSSLPDISKWDTSKVTDMFSMFEDCNTLSSLPNISKWDTSKVTNKYSMFDGCIILLNIPS